MPNFPNGLDDVATLKVHPAIGIARLANNDSVYEFFASESVRNAQAKTPNYMTDSGGKPTLMRQSVQFRLYAYNAAGNPLGELTAGVMGSLSIEPTWTASVANRKLHNYSKRRGDPVPIPEVAASESAKGAEVKQLDGTNPFDPAQTINLGSISGTGLFEPPRGGVYRKAPNSQISRYPANETLPIDSTDTTSDGSIVVALSGTNLPVVPAWIVVAPQQHSFDVNPGDPGLPSTNKDFGHVMRTRLGIAPPPVTEPSELDALSIKPVAGDFNPGMEICFEPGRMEFHTAADAFYPNELRVRPAAAGPGGALPGQLTSGLCSTWQGDLVACLDYWTAQFPNKVERESDDNYVPLFRKDYASDVRMGNTEDINANADFMGVARDVYQDNSYLRETERKP